ncbi:hypothetical protein E4U42_007620 [Claviceps africana]|uniref:Uncharacterized protein n=1 Tax=Claviceps africana TaxID=83212 RepID=A0A8K0NG26_9HYPO|nr:hypothetical protein E4U42_007620 [Claviceps africana]
MTTKTETGTEQAPTPTADIPQLVETGPESQAAQVSRDSSANNDAKHGADGKCPFERRTENSQRSRSRSILKPPNPTETIIPSIEQDDTEPALIQRSRRKRKHKHKCKSKSESEKKRNTRDKRRRLEKTSQAIRKHAKPDSARELSSRIPLKEPKARAARPRIPDPLDDDEEPDDEFTPNTDAANESQEEEEPSEAGAGTAPPATVIPATRRRRFMRQRQPSPHLEESSPSIPSDFDKLPSEIRYMIYEELLTVRQPILVHSGWQQVYKRARPCIPTGILRTCRRFYQEAIRVLYGSNTFLYRLRDKIPSMTDVDRVALMDEDGAALPTTTNDDNEAGDEDEDPEPDDVNDPDWQEEFVTTARSSNARRTRRPQHPVPVVQPDIHVTKHLHLFRRLIVEAEKNRFAQGTKKLMANAIQTFACPSPPTGGTTTNIKTLTICVAPQWDGTAGPDGYGRFTFVDFFEAHSAVMRAIRNINCQFLQLDLRTGYMDMERSLTRPGRRCTIDMRYRRIVNRIKNGGRDEWKHDTAMQEARRWKVNFVAEVLRSLEKQVRGFCETYLGHETGDVDAWGMIPFDFSGGHDGGGGDDDDID